MLHSASLAGAASLLPPLGEGRSLGVSSLTANILTNQEQAEQLIQEKEGTPSWENRGGTREEGQVIQSNLPTESF